MKSWMWDGIAVRGNGIVECSAVTTMVPVTRGLFREHVQWRRSVAGRRVDDAQLHQGFSLKHHSGAGCLTINIPRPGSAPLF